MATVKRFDRESEEAFQRRKRLAEQAEPADVGEAGTIAEGNILIPPRELTKLREIGAPAALRADARAETLRRIGETSQIVEKATPIQKQAEEFFSKEEPKKDFLGEISSIFKGGEAFGIPTGIDLSNRSDIRAGTVPIGAAGAGGLLGASEEAAAAALANRAQIVGKARNILTKFKNGGFELFGHTIGLKEAIVGGLTAGQSFLSLKLRNINSEASKLGSERNEKIARAMVSGLDPDLAIQVYEEDKEFLRQSDETLQLLKIFSFENYLVNTARGVHLNIQNQIDAKDSRILEAQKFKEGLTTAEIQQAGEISETVKGG